MARYQVILTYDGTDFMGFQRQKNLRTVQSEVEKTLRSLGWSDNSIISAGRTDTGVHAVGQVISFDMEWNHSAESLKNALNAGLPWDIAAHQVIETHDKFHPRFDALARHYQYRILIEPDRNPLRERYAWRIWPDLDFALLNDAGEMLIGTHDFAAFGAPHTRDGVTQRRIFQAKWAKNGNELLFNIIGNAFLYHMVRRLVAYQIEIGRGRLAIDLLRQQLCSPGDTSAAGTAPASGLCLTAVYYPGAGSEETYLYDLEVRQPKSFV